MSHAPLRPYTDTRRLALADILEALAVELRRDDAGRTQTNLRHAIEAGYSATASGAGPGGGSGGGDVVLTVVEAKASRTDRTQGTAALLLLRLHRAERDATLALDELRGWRGDRPTGICSEGHPLRAGQTRCTQCGTRRETVRVCGNERCGKTMLTGQPLRRKVIEGVELQVCNRCFMYADRHDGRAWGDALRLTYPGVNEAGVYTEEDPWAGSEDPATSI